jgi:rubrerythrin
MIYQESVAGRNTLFSIREIMGLAVKLEKNGERFYRGAASRFSAPRLSALLRWLADEELRHTEWFSAKHSSLKLEEGERDVEETGDEILREILGDQTFSLQEVDLSSIQDQMDLLDIAIEFENDTVLFYEVLSSLVEDRETMERVSEIIAQEQTHIESLQALRSGAVVNKSTSGG